MWCDLFLSLIPTGLQRLHDRTMLHTASENAAAAPPIVMHADIFAASGWLAYS